MPLKLCANLSFMFQEIPSLLERYKAARDAGFKAVECAFPYVHSLDDVSNAREKADVQQILINVDPGDLGKGELGFAALPEAEEKFKESILRAVQYAKALKCSRIHIMSGTVKQPTEDNWKTYTKNIDYAKTLFEKENIVGLIEPINPYSVPNYYMNDFNRALDLVKSCNSPNIKIMMDMFHLQHLCGNLTKNIEKLLPYVGHIQVAQVPDRHEPNSSGEINYEYVFSVLEKQGYDGWIGLEYKPKAKTVEGLGWIKQYNLKM